jgi:hypothetical protein
MSIPDGELAAIAAHVAGMSQAQIAGLRDGILAEVIAMEARMPEHTPPDDPGRFQLKRDQASCAQRRREIDYLDQVLATPLVQR